jgi:hypothetical protein
MLWRFSYSSMLPWTSPLHKLSERLNLQSTTSGYYFCVVILTNLTNSIYKFKDWQPLDYATTWLLSSPKTHYIPKKPSTTDQLYKCSVMGPILYCDNHSRNSHHLLAILFTFEIFFSNLTHISNVTCSIQRHKAKSWINLNNIKMGYICHSAMEWHSSFSSSISMDH